jgi:hypothetical protein
MVPELPATGKLTGRSIERPVSSSLLKSTYLSNPLAGVFPSHVSPAADTFITSVS